MKCTYPGYKKYSTQNTARMQKGPGSSVERSHGEVTGLKWWWLQDPRNGHQNHIYFIYFNIMLLIYDRIMSHQLYTPDIKTNLDPRVLNFCLGFSHSTSWCFRQRRQGRTSMASSCNEQRHGLQRDDAEGRRQKYRPNYEHLGLRRRKRRPFAQQLHNPAMFEPVIFCWYGAFILSP